MKIKKMIKALKNIKMMCDDLPTCVNCPFYLRPGGCVFLPIGHTGGLPQNWDLKYIGKEVKENES